MLRNLLEGFVGWRKHRIIGSSPIQGLHQIWVLVDEFCEPGGVLGTGDEFIDGLARFVMRTMMGWEG